MNRLEQLLVPGIAARQPSPQLDEVDLAPPARTKNSGLEESVAPVGTEVTILGKRNLDAKKFEVKTERVTVGGKNYDVYPDRL